MARRSAVLGIAVLLCLTGCAGGPMTEPTPSEPTSSEPTPSEPTSSEPTPSEPTPSEPTPSAHTRPPFATTPRGPIAPTGEPAIVPPARWDAIVADLAARGVTGTPELKSAHAVTWNNGALGCPSPGVSYTQALVDGMRVVVSVDGTTYDYRFGTSDSPKLCTR